MGHNYKISYFKPEVQGVFSSDGAYSFAVEMPGRKDCGVILYERNGRTSKIPFSEKGKRGTLYGVRIEGKGIEKCRYRYYEGDTEFTDSYAKGISGLETWGDCKGEKRVPFGRMTTAAFDWEGDEPLEIPYENTVIYGLNVRAFTRHKSSGVKNKGTFEGIVEKIPYLKELGITAIELMPAYEYEECMIPETGIPATMDEAIKNCTVPTEDIPMRINCWGFQKGFYFAPKASYSKGVPEVSFKQMVKSLHQNGIEVIMQFYFPPAIQSSYILEVIKYWVIEYHIDGVRLSGFDLPLAAIAQEPVLKTTKIRSAYFNAEEIYGDEVPVYRNLLADNGNFRNDMRRFLKGDENLMNQVVQYHKSNPAFYAVVNGIADYDGFSLYDLVSYERKHNEANGENNSDGTDCNYSWNCGAEGECKKKSVTELRKKQIKNALSFLFLSQGVPFIFSGDEFGDTRFGNNNTYCQDNETGWVNWKRNRFSDEILEFTRFMIQLRKEHPIFRQTAECKVLDTLSCGYPDISYHGTEAWRPDMSYISRMVGIMLCGKYITEKEEPSFYIAYNMHWEPHKLAFPKLPKGFSWKKVYDTSDVSEKEGGLAISDENMLLVEGRSVSLYCSVQNEPEKGKKTTIETKRKLEHK